MKIYRDNRDWWIGYFRARDYHYVCLLPTIVIKWETKSMLMHRLHVVYNKRFELRTRLNTLIGKELSQAETLERASLEGVILDLDKDISKIKRRLNLK